MFCAFAQHTQPPLNEWRSSVRYPVPEEGTRKKKPGGAAGRSGDTRKKQQGGAADGRGEGSEASPDEAAPLGTVELKVLLQQVLEVCNSGCEVQGELGEGGGGGSGWG